MLQLVPVDLSTRVECTVQEISTFSKFAAKKNMDKSQDCERKNMISIIFLHVNVQEYVVLHKLKFKTITLRLRSLVIELL